MREDAARVASRSLMFSLDEAEEALNKQDAELAKRNRRAAKDKPCQATMPNATKWR